MVFKPLREAEDETHFDETAHTEVCQPQSVLNTSNDEPGPQELSRQERRTQRDRQARILAERRGINPSFDLPAVCTTERPEHQDGCLQTLLFPDDLEERLRKIQQEAITALQETGANTLHLLFGFLEWHDVPSSQLTEKDMRAAPLVLVPVTLTRRDLDKQTRTFLYSVSASGEDWNVNITLQEKCRREFGVELPDIRTGDEPESLEDYFRRVEEMLLSAPLGWRLRRQVTLGLVSFGKLLMWRDLDQRNWLPGGGLLSNPLLRDILGAVREEDGDGSTLVREEYPIDDLPSTLRPTPPIVMDADSSQHSVLVDALKGKNLVVQGPPGTGKSQTIANLIGAALLAGKRVLFVAEKKAALDVVHRRLAEIGLGDFCVALHSHSSQKRAFLQDLANRMSLRGQVHPSERLSGLQPQLTHYQRALNGHPQRLHHPNSRLGKTPFEVLWIARCLLDEIGPDLERIIRDVRIAGVSSLEEDRVTQAVATAQDFGAAAVGVLGNGARCDDHPWAALEAIKVGPAELDRLIDAFRILRTVVGQLLEQCDALHALVGVRMTPAARSLAAFAEAIDSLPLLSPTVLSHVVSRIATESVNTDISHLLDEVDALQTAWRAIASPWGPPSPLTLEQAQEFAGIVERALGHASASITIESLGVQQHRLERAIRQLDRIADRTSRVCAAIDLRAPVTLNAVHAVETVIRAAQSLDNTAFVLRNDALQEPSAPATLQNLQERAAELLTSRCSLEKRFPSAFRPSIQEIARAVEGISTAPRMLPWLLSAQYRDAVRLYRAMSAGDSAHRDVMLAGLRSLVQQTTNEQQFGEISALSRLFGAHAAGIESPFDQAAALLAWIRTVGMTTTMAGDAGRALMACVWTAPHTAWRTAAHELLRDGDDPTEIPVLLAELRAVMTDLDGEAGLLNATIDELAAQIREKAEALAAIALVVRHGQVDSLSTLADLDQRVHAVLAAWQQADALGEHLPLLQRMGLATLGDRDGLARALDATRFMNAVRHLNVSTQMREWICSGDVHTRVRDIKGLALVTGDIVGRCRRAVAQVEILATVRWQRWAENSTAEGDAGSDVARLPRLQRSLDRALEAESTLYAWELFLRTRKAMDAASLGEIAALVERGAVAPVQAKVAAEAALYYTLANHLLRADDGLAQFAGETHSQALHRFADLDKQVMEETRRYIRFKLSQSPKVPGSGYGAVAALTEEALIEYQAGRRRPRITIRGLFARAGRAIQTMKPCFMMGPQSVAQYLTPGRFQFDMVVMDEASQMRPEDALGAIARGSQLIVVGDPMQLGPSSFFDKQGEEDEDAEYPDEDGAPPPVGPTVLERSESILLAAAARYPTRLLRWHYRSRHPKLIAFSNREFYHSDLIVFPSPNTILAEDGVTYHQVGDGVYVDNTNVVEAQAVVEAVRRHAHERAERTLVIVTLNIHQRDLILGLLERAEKEDDTLAAFRRRHAEGPEPLEVKNLENVQGDERDVVMVSITFGRSPSGQLLQNFGPINKTGGERRLNVLFTRAKHRLEVFCSFDPADLRVEEKTPRGVQVLRDYLRYAQDAHWASGRPNLKEADSPFEIAVARALGGRGLKVDFQVGVAGYFVDLAVVHPQHPGSYVLGVECDGATYHSAKSARDRDRLRQQVLENLGWKIHRIWSTDWFRDPAGQSARVAERVKEILESSARSV